MRSMLALAVLLPAIVQGQSLAQAQAQLQSQTPARQERLDQGRRVAETWCADCHVVGPGARGPAGDAAPPFAAVARVPSTTGMSLRAFLQTPHARMPDYRLTGEELDGVVAWILAQAPR